ncbi:MAG: GNAT family N-acetyltransferase [Actinomycetota bacterium]
MSDDKTCELRTIRPEELKLWAQTCEATFGHELHENDLPRWEKVFEIERCLAAFEDDAMVATTGAFTFGMTVPGGQVPVAGVTAVGVLPSHRRRGLLSQMMAMQLHDVHRRGEPLAILWASEGPIYHRFGYGMGSLHGSIDIERDRTSFRDAAPPQGRTRVLDLQSAAKVLPDIYERARVAFPGSLVRSQAWWETTRLSDPEYEREGAGPKFCAVLELEGRGEGYALYRIRNDWPDGSPRSTLQVLEAVATSDVAMRETWRFLFGIDLIERLQAWFLPVDHPLLVLLAEPRRLHFRLSDALWVRMVDVPAALAARRYAADGSLVVAVTDALCPWNEGRWRLEVSGGSATVTETTDRVDLEVDVRDLGSTYLGGFGFTDLHRGGRLPGAAPDALAAADRMFAAERKPWIMEIF